MYGRVPVVQGIELPAETAFSVLGFSVSMAWLISATTGVGPASKDVPESTIATQPPSQTPIDEPPIKEKISHFNLPVTFFSNRNVNVFSFEMLRVDTTKNQFTTLFALRFPIEPKREHLLTDKILFHHIVPYWQSSCN